ncbi:MAG: hypothetical protein JWO67_2684 [Streptosporangiaceae bacterium]|nr:hypothetical protein [Streptosporangiaceae bacterium]
MLDINRIQITGDAEFWIALPDGYEATGGFYKRTAIGGKKTLDMLRDVANEAKRLPSDAQTYLVFSYSAALLNDPKHGQDIKRQISDLERNAKGSRAVFIDTTQDARPTR